NSERRASKILKNECWLVCNQDGRTKEIHRRHSGTQAVHCLDDNIRGLNHRAERRRVQYTREYRPLHAEPIRMKSTRDILQNERNLPLGLEVPYLARIEKDADVPRRHVANAHRAVRAREHRPRNALEAVGIACGEAVGVVPRGEGVEHVALVEVILQDHRPELKILLLARPPLRLSAQLLLRAAGALIRLLPPLLVSLSLLLLGLPCLIVRVACLPPALALIRALIPSLRRRRRGPSRPLPLLLAFPLPLARLLLALPSPRLLLSLPPLPLRLAPPLLLPRPPLPLRARVRLRLPFQPLKLAHPLSHNCALRRLARGAQPQPHNVLPSVPPAKQEVSPGVVAAQRVLLREPAAAARLGVRATLGGRDARGSGIQPHALLLVRHTESGRGELAGAAGAIFGEAEAHGPRGRWGARGRACGWGAIRRRSCPTAIRRRRGSCPTIVSHGSASMDDLGACWLEVVVVGRRKGREERAQRTEGAKQLATDVICTPRGESRKRVVFSLVPRVSSQIG
ncbi:hypothetical protein C8R44DRAFT_948602, partial [Mycena epipterygia]